MGLNSSSLHSLRQSEKTTGYHSSRWEGVTASPVTAEEALGGGHSLPSRPSTGVRSQPNPGRGLRAPARPEHSWGPFPTPRWAALSGPALRRLRALFRARPCSPPPGRLHSGPGSAAPPAPLARAALNQWDGKGGGVSRKKRAGLAERGGQ